MDEQFRLLLQQCRQEIDKRLFGILDGHKPSLLYDPIHYVLKGGGKRIRPILLVFACQAVGGRLSDCWPAAVSVELLHNFTLVHDDMMDRDDTRRGRPTVHKKWDSDIALLAGDGLVALAYKALLLTNSDKVDEIARIFSNGIIELCEGQALDLDFETREEIGLEEYLEMITKKTGKLLNICAQIGAMIGNGTENEIEALGNFGDNLGCAFQIQDDLLDITSDEITTGKTFGSDVKRRKQTYLLVHALNHADSRKKKRLNELLKVPEIDRMQINEVESIFEQTGSIAAAKSTINEYFQSAHNNLKVLQSTQGKESLLSLLEYISKRNS